MTKSDGLTEMLAGVIRGVLDGDISPARANAICNVTAQIVKIAQIKHKSFQGIVDSIAIPDSQSLRLMEQSVDDSRAEFENRIFSAITQHGPMTFKEMAARLDMKWEYVEALARDDERLMISGNEIYLDVA